MKYKNLSDIKKITKPKDIYQIMKGIYNQNDEFDKEKEQLYLIGLDTKLNVITIDLISMGTVNETLISPRDFFRTAIFKNCVSVIMVHNHPSGDKNPSGEDLVITKKICKGGELLGIPLVDHLIYVDDDYLSFASEGLLK